MNSYFKKSIIMTMMLVLLTSCAPKAEPTPAVDKVATRAIELAALMQTQTAAAIPPTLPPTNTPEPTPTETLSPTPVEVQDPRIKNDPAPCYVKPDPSSVLTSNITGSRIVYLLAVGADPGWYKIENPYFGSPCWITSDYLIIDPNMDLSAFPVE